MNPHNVAMEGEVVSHELVSPKVLKKGFAFGDRDLEILRLIYDYGLIRRDHLSLLTGRSMKRLHRRLYQLLDEEFIVPIKHPQQKHIYWLTKKSHHVLVEHGQAGEELLKKRVRAREVKPSMIKHEMMIVDTHVVLELASRSSSYKLIEWREGTELFDSVVMNGEKYAVRPDAFFTIEDVNRPVGKNRRNFFLEADRTSMNPAQMRSKFLALWEYLAQGLHTRKYNVMHIRIVTLVLTKERASYLSKVAASVLPDKAQKYFLFGVESNFSVSNPCKVYEPIFWCPKVSECVPLIPVEPNPSPA